MAVSFADCKGLGTDPSYDGIESKTQSGLTCQTWMITHEIYNETNISNHFLFKSLRSAKNYCRNPNRRPGGPWCYTMDRNRNVTWDYCDIAICGQSKL